MFGKLSWAPGARSFGVTTWNRVRSDQNTPTNVPIIDGRFLDRIDPRFERLSNLNLAGPNYHQEEDRATVRYTRQLGRSSSLVGLFGYRDVRYQFIDDGDVIGSPFDLAAHTLTMYPFEQTTDEHISYSQLRFEGGRERSGRQNTGRQRAGQLVAGGSFEATSGFVAGNLIYTDEDTLGWSLDYLEPVHPPRSQWSRFPIGGDDYRLLSSGLFAHYRWAPAERFALVAGARWDRFELENTRTRSPGRPHLEDTIEATSPKLGVTYLVRQGRDGAELALFGSFAAAFVPPRRPSQLRPTNTPVDLEPEDVDQAEVGAKGTALGGRLSFQGALFLGERSGIVVNVRRGPFFLPSNAGEHDYRGAEAEARFAWSDGFTAYANIAASHNRFGEFVIQSSGGDTVLTGNRLPIAPDLVWNLGVLLRPLRVLDAVLNVKHVGDVAVDQGNSAELPAHTLVDAAVSWRLRPVVLTVSAHNLFDQDYWSNGDTGAGETADPGRPRQLLVSASFHWPGRR